MHPQPSFCFQSHPQAPPSGPSLASNLLQALVGSDIAIRGAGAPLPPTKVVDRPEWGLNLMEITSLMKFHIEVVSHRHLSA